MSDRAAHQGGSSGRRRRTRWLLLGFVAAMAALIGGSVALEAVHPQLDTAPLRVEGVPPLASDEVVACIRRADDTTPHAIELDRGGRISSTQVYACPLAFDGREVTYVGEVIGELLRRDGGVWVQVNDDPYALEVGPVIGHREHAGFNTGLSVWLPDGLHERITDVGRPAQRGDVVLLRGTLLRTDPDDGGGTTLRATELEVLAEAVVIEPPLHGLQVVVATVLGALALASVGWARHRRRL